MASYLAAVGTFCSIYALLALGLSLMWGMAGMTNLGIMGYYALGGYASALISLKLGWPIPLGMAAGVALATLVGAATCIGVVRVRDDYLAIVTLGFAEIIRLIAENETWLTNGTDGLPQVPQLLGGVFGRDYPFFYLALCITALTGGLLLAERLRGSPFGRVLRAIRDDPAVALAGGKNVLAFQVRSLALGAALMGLAGALYAHYTSYVSPYMFDPERLIYVFFAVILGGRGNNYGAVLGTVLVVGLDEVTRFVVAEMHGLGGSDTGAIRQIIIGVCFLLILRLRPGGVLAEPRLKAGYRAGAVMAEMRHG
jgi:branched-chain amino acid transport system permease protein